MVDELEDDYWLGFTVCTCEDAAWCVSDEQRKIVDCLWCGVPLDIVLDIPITLRQARRLRGILDAREA